MAVGAAYDHTKGWFLWGIVLVGLSSIPFLVMSFTAFRGVSQEKATGLGAVAGGLTEGYATLGCILTVILPLGAIVLLCKSFSGGQRVRKIFAVLSICWSVALLFLFGLGAWMVFVEAPRLTGRR